MKRKLLNAALLTALLLVLMAALTTTACAAQHFRTCPFCGSTNFDEGGGSYVAPTCTAKGSVKIYCSCNQYQARTYTIKALGHDWGEWKTVRAATCEKQGERKHTCARCGVTEKEKTKKKAHSYGKWTIVREATDHTKGLRRRTCDKCGDVQEDEFYPEGTLRKDGDNDKKAVKDLQNALNKAGYNCGKADGAFGKNTKKAVEDFQRDHGLDPDGIAWPQTQDLLFGRKKEPKALPEKPAEEIIDFNLQATQTSPAQETYAAGDTVDFDLVLSNDGNVTLTHPRVLLYVNDTTTGKNWPVYDTDPANPDGGSMGPGEQHRTIASYTFTEEDMENTDGTLMIILRGEVDNPQETGALCSDAVFEYKLEEPAGGFKGYTPFLTSGVTFTAREQTSSADPSGYAVGEKVTFECVFTNEGNTDIAGADISASTDGGLALLIESYSKVAAEEAKTCLYDYIIQPEDQTQGSVTFAARADWINPVTLGLEMLEAEPVTVLVLPEDPLVTKAVPNTGLTAVKKEYSASKDPAGYTVGEQIVFEITLENHTPFTFSFTGKDWTEPSGYLTTVESIAPGEARVWRTTPYTVQESDLKPGQITNTASFEWVNQSIRIEGGKRGTLSTNTVTVQVIPKVVAPPVKKTTPKAKLKTTPAAGDCCKRSLKFVSEYDEEYLLHSCAGHLQTREEVTRTVNAAKTAAQKQAAWQQACLLWQEELESLYDACRAGANAEGLAVIEAEQTRFDACLAAYEQLLSLLWPDQPALALEKKAQVLMDRVADLCFLVHTAPSDRADSYITGSYEAIDGISMDYDNCAFETVKTEGSDVSCLVIPCAAHCETALEARNLILSEQGTEAAFTEAAALWIDALNESYRELYKGRSGSDRSVITGECGSFSDWLAADLDFLMLFYPDKPETAAEVICAELRNKCLRLCNEMNSAGK